MDLVALVEKTVVGLGYEFVDLERAGRGLLRVFIDKPDDGVGVEDCMAVSNQLTRLFAVEDIPYERLEVSSPGLDRPLRKTADFQRFMGREVKLKMRTPRSGQRNFLGHVESVSEDILVLLTPTGAVEFLRADIDRAHLVPEL
ncbi:MAG: ribosome maturation factor RimP [Ferrovum sp.]|nr:ribosome maturation factor RimP [Ferrovum sp.]NDU87780.1 ribosome maturation factor RimP [Ferrovum sp.]